jgi:hypothetical protein
LPPRQNTPDAPSRGGAFFGGKSSSEDANWLGTCATVIPSHAKARRLIGDLPETGGVVAPLYAPPLFAAISFWASRFSVAKSSGREPLEAPRRIASQRSTDP